MGTTKPWQLAEWKKNKKEWLKNNTVCLWCGSTKNITPHHPNKDESKEKYMSLETAIPLCRKCHLMLHQGFLICEKCKKHYHKPNFNLCWNCYKEKNPGAKTEAERIKEFDDAIHKEDEELFQRWICKNCKYLKLPDIPDAEFMSMLYQNSSCKKLGEFNTVPFPTDDPDAPEVKQECKYYHI